MRHDVVDRDRQAVAAPDRLDAPSLLDLAAVDDVDGEAPEYFRDVSLDRIVERMLAGLSEYRLEPVLYRTLSSPAAVVFRQEIFRDLHGRPLSGAMHAFAGRMRTVRRALEQARVLRLDLQRQGAFLSAVRTYCAAVATLAHDLADADLRSAGLRGTRAYVDAYLASPGFARLDLESSRVEHALAEIVYCLEVGRDHARVTPFDGQADYAEKVEQTFARFHAGGPRPVAATRDAAADMNMLETAVLRMVARLFPGPSRPWRPSPNGTGTSWIRGCARSSGRPRSTSPGSTSCVRSNKRGCPSATPSSAARRRSASRAATTSRWRRRR